MIIFFCAFLVLKAKYIQFHSNFRAGKKGKIRGLSVAERAKSVALNEEGHSERQISKKLKFSKTAIYQANVKFRNFGRPKVTFQRNDHLIK